MMRYVQQVPVRRCTPQRMTRAQQHRIVPDELVEHRPVSKDLLRVRNPIHGSVALAQSRFERLDG